MTKTVTLATPPQKRYLRDLIAKRETLEVERSALEVSLDSGTLTLLECSAWISSLRVRPLLPRVELPVRYTGADTSNKLTEAYAAVPNGRFIITRAEVLAMFPGYDYAGEEMFFEIRSWKGRRYLNKLVGGGDNGSFIRKSVKADVLLPLLGLLAVDPVSRMRAFGEMFTCCGRCGRSLTDAESRKTFFGPECRKALAL